MKIITEQVHSYTDVETSIELLAVPWKIVNDDETTALEGIQSFILTATEEEIKDFLKRRLQTFKENLALSQAAAENADAAQAGAETAAAVTNLSIE